MIGIYKITNTLNGKIYVGKSENDIEYRLHQHKIGSNSNEHLQRSISKYGIENFKFEVLEECSKEDCIERERFWIRELDCMYPNGYNYTSGGENESGFSFCTESRVKMSESAKKRSETEEGKRCHSNGGRSRKWTKEEREKVSNTLKNLYSDKTKVPMYGKHHSDNTKRKMSEQRSGSNHPMYGKHHSEESRKKLSEANSGRVWVHKEDVQCQIKKSDLDKYLSNGYSLGMLSKRNKFVSM